MSASRCSCRPSSKASARRRGVSGDLRVIARRVFLDKLPLHRGERPRHARCDAAAARTGSSSRRAGRRARASSRFDDDAHARFDHLTVNGKLERDARRFPAAVHRPAAHARRAPRARAATLGAAQLEPGTTRIARTTLRCRARAVHGRRVHRATARAAARGSRQRIAGRLGSHRRRAARRALRFRPKSAGFAAAGPSMRADRRRRPRARAAITRASARCRGEVAARCTANSRSTSIPRNAVNVRAPGARRAARVNLGGRLVDARCATPRAVRSILRAQRRSCARARASGTRRAQPLGAHRRRMSIARCCSTAGHCSRATRARRRCWLTSAAATWSKATESADAARRGRRRAVNWQRSSGKLQLAGACELRARTCRASSAGRGTLEFARGDAKLLLDGGEVEQLAVTSARVDWPRTARRACTPRCRATWRRRAAPDVARPGARSSHRHGDARSGCARREGTAPAGTVARQRALARRVGAARRRSAAASKNSPAPLRYSGGQLRGAGARGHAGSVVRSKSNRAAPTARGSLSFAISGVADAAPLLRLLGKTDAASRVERPAFLDGHGAALERQGRRCLAAVARQHAHRRREPAARAVRQARARALPVNAQLRVDVDGIQDFSSRVAAIVKIRGAFENGVTTARFEVQGVTGELRRDGQCVAARFASSDSTSSARRRCSRWPRPCCRPTANSRVNIDDLRHGDRSLGARAGDACASRDAGVEFSLESTQSAPHQMTAQGRARAMRAAGLEFTADTDHLAALLRGIAAAGGMAHRDAARGRRTVLARRMSRRSGARAGGQFDLETQGRDSSHQLLASATLADGQIALANVQGTGPAADQVFRGSGRVACWRANTTSRSTTSGCRWPRAPCRRRRARASRAPGPHCAVRSRAAAGPKSPKRAACNGTAPGTR